MESTNLLELEKIGRTQQSGTPHTDRVQDIGHSLSTTMEKDKQALNLEKDMREQRR